MSEKINQPKKNEAEQNGVVNIGDISSISGDKINITGDESSDAPVQQESSRIVDIEGGSYIEGNIKAGGVDFLGRDTIDIAANLEDVIRLFNNINDLVDEKEDATPEEKDDLHLIIKEIEVEAIKGEETDESILARRLRMLGKVSPDIFEIVLDTLGNPEAGISEVTRNVAMKMRFTSGSGDV
jgi:hypothetical protein